MHWLIRFAQRNLSGLSDGDFLNLQYEILHFEFYRPFAHMENKKMLPPALLISATSLPPLTRIQVLQEEVNARLERILAGQATTFEFNSLELNLFPPHKFEVRGGPNSWELLPSVAGSGSAFNYSLAHLLAKYAGDLRQCPGCQKIFLARSNQYHCSVNCQSRLAQVRARTRQGHPPGGKRGRPPKLSTNKPAKKRGKK